MPRARRISSLGAYAVVYPAQQASPANAGWQIKPPHGAPLGPMGPLYGPAFSPLAMRRS